MSATPSHSSLLSNHVVQTAHGSAKNLPISPYWSPEIQYWGELISVLSAVYGFHPDFIAAVMQEELVEEKSGIINLGAFRLLNLMPGVSLPEIASTTQESPTINPDLHWGMTILSYVIQQSGGDLYTALAAYNGGWGNINNQMAQEYAARVLDSYGRALVERSGLSPDMTNRWTIAVDIRAGNVPSEGLIILGSKPISTVRMYTSHTVYTYADATGRAYYIRGYAVPIGLSDFVTQDFSTKDLYNDDPNQLEASLRARLGEKFAHDGSGNPRVILACLQSMSRLRGQMTTRWYSPSHCPDIER